MWLYMYSSLDLQVTRYFILIVSYPWQQAQKMGLVRITSWYPEFNGSHFGLPPSSIHTMTGLGGKMVWTMTYSNRLH